ncbi:LysR family transcriptional regulator [Mycolicibacterium boenickei]|nr:LysR family transcriptional regulator [Mycolicibacterium boenickei]
MELRQLEYLVAVAEEESFTKAAARMHVAQSGVSAQILLLERELGQRLFDRSRPAVRLTKVGTALLKHARAALAAVADAKQVADEYGVALRGHVSVGLAASSSLAFDLVDMLAQFHRDHPLVEISLLEANTDDLVNGLLDGRHDVAIISPPATVPPDLRLQLVADERLVAVMSPDHPFAGRSALVLEDLTGCQLITFSSTIGTRSTIDAAFTAAGIQPHVAIEASDPNVLAELASGGLGVALIPEPYARARDSRLHVMQIADLDLRGCLALVWNSARKPSASAARLIDHARRSLQSGQTVSP